MHRHRYIRLWTSGAAYTAFAIALLALATHAHAEAACCKPGDCPEHVYSGNRLALVVGVDKYSGATPEIAGNGLIDLKNSVKDAMDIAGILSPYYSVRCLINPSAKEFLGELKRLAAKLQSLRDGPAAERDGNSVILHFSGHGFRSSDEDYIFLSGNFASMEDANSAGAVPIDYIASTFQEFSQFEKVFIFDACRNYMNMNGEPVKPNWLQGGFGKAEAHYRTWQAIVYSTEAGAFAYDRNESIGANENGAFIFSLKKYLQLNSLTLLKVVEIMRTDPAMISIKQMPAVDSRDPFEPTPWTRKVADTCRTFEMHVASSMASCRKPDSDIARCMARLEVCKSFNEMERQREQGCSTKPVLNIFPELICAPPLPGTPLAQTLGVTYLATGKLEIPDLSKEALLASSQLRFDRVATVRPIGDRSPASVPAASVSEMVDNLNTIARVEERTSAPKSAVAPVRTEILAKGRTSLTRSFDIRATAPLVVTAGDIELYNVPGLGGGTTGRLKPTGQPKIDCETQYCDPNWVMVRVPVGNTTVDGWLPADRVTARPAAATVELDYPGQELVPTRDTREKLKSFSQDAKKLQNAVIKITAVISAPANDETRTIAAARLAQLKVMLEGRAAPLERISSHIIEAEAVGVQPSVTVNLLNP